MGRGRVLAAFALASVGTLVGVWTATAPASATEREVRAPERYSLDNGLDVVLDPIPGRTTVAVVVSVDAGRRDQPDGWTGLAHLTEHLLFQGTPAAPGETMTRLERLGASQINAETGNDFTRYYEVVPAARLEETLWLEAERFAHGLDGLDEAGVNAQRRVLDREREVRTHGRAEVWDLVDEILYPEGHPYSRSREEASDVHAVRLRDVRWFFQRHYAPDMLTLSISGGFDPAEVRPWIERYFGPLRRGGVAAPPAWTVQPEVDIEGERRVLAEASRSTDALYVIWPTPPWGTPADAALDFVSSHLEPRLTERLVREGEALSVDVTQGASALANRFSVWVTVPRRSGTLFEISVVVPVQAVGDAAASIVGELSRLCDADQITSEGDVARPHRRAGPAVGVAGHGRRARQRAGRGAPRGGAARVDPPDLSPRGARHAGRRRGGRLSLGAAGPRAHGGGGRLALAHLSPGAGPGWSGVHQSLSGARAQRRYASTTSISVITPAPRSSSQRHAPTTGTPR